MATILDKFNSAVSGSKGTINDYLPIIAPKGDFTRISGIDVIINSYRTILLTSKGTYDHDPDFGCDLYKFIYEPATETTRQSLELVITDQLLRYEDRAKLAGMEIYFLNNKKGFVMNVALEYKDEKKNLSLTIDESMASRSK